MRVFTVILLAVLAACSKAPQQREATPAEITFDGAEVRQAAAARAHGERLSWVLGCRGCHGPNLQGHRFYERYASNLTRELPKYSDAQIERALRTGVPRDGRDLWGMPSEIFQHLSGSDMAALIAHLRAVKPEGIPTQPPLPWTKEGREVIASGELKTAAATVIQDRRLMPVDLGPNHAFGRYIATVTCAECHGPELKGHPKFAPDLVAAAAYTRPEFERLITRGIPTGGRKLGLMAEVAEHRFSHLTKHERDGLYAYLKARAEQPQ